MNIKTMENKVKVWLERDVDGKLLVYSTYPTHLVFMEDVLETDGLELDPTKFPSVKWKDAEPTEAYITLAEQQEQPTPKQEIDWEQRRYETAKEMMPVLYRQGVEILKYGQKFEWKEIVDGAVNFADILIEKLKEKSE